MKKAEALCKEALEIDKRTREPEYPNTISIMGWLATTWKYQGRDKIDVALKAECVALSSQVSGFDHSWTQLLHLHLEEWTNLK
jgi:hypothetical protein